MSPRPQPFDVSEAYFEQKPEQIDTSLQRHEPGQFESKSDPDEHPPEIFTVRKKSQEGQCAVFQGDLNEPMYLI